MHKKYVVIILLIHSVFVDAVRSQVLDTSARWVWMAGGKTINESQTGAFRVAGANNTPNKRLQSTTIWCDKTGKIWLFGGTPSGGGNLNTGRNDLWVFDRTMGSNGEWYWQGGPAPQHGSAVGIKGGPAHVDNIPKARSQAGKWVDKDGNFWLFGGLQTNGIYVNNSGAGNDLWKFNPVTREWRWVSGDTVNVTPATHKTGVYPAVKGGEGIPGGRNAMVTWTDNAGNLWLFGGFGVTNSSTAGQLGDIWKFDVSQEKWFWMGGTTSINAPVDYNGAAVPGSPGGFPGGRQSLAGWSDLNGNLYIFGGVGSAGSGSLLSDMWRYNPTLDEWTWIMASTPNADYGTPGVQAASNHPGRLYIIGTATDKYGKFWMFGGRHTPGNDNMQNTLWKFDPDTKMWTAINGFAGNDARGSYGTKYVADKQNQPGARQSFICYCEDENELWLFGGAGWGESGTTRGPLNDLWKFAHVAPPTCTLTANITPSSATSFCPGDSVILYANKIAGATYEWYEGSTLLSNTSDSIIVKTPGSYSVKITDGSCDATSSTVAVNLHTLPAANPSPSGVQYICSGSSLAITAPGSGMNYQWYHNGSAVGTNAATLNATLAGLYTVVVTNPTTGCRDSSSAPTDLRLHLLPDASLTPSGVGAICSGDSLVLSATNTGANLSYEWYRDGVAIPGALAANYKLGQNGEYRVKVTDQSTGCADTSSVAAVIVVHPLPVVTITPTGTVELCQGDQLQLTISSSSGITNEWLTNNTVVGTGMSLSVASAGIYYVRATDNNNCVDSSATATIVLRGRPQFTVTPGDTAFCEGGLVLYEVNTHDTGIHFQWKKDNAHIPSAQLAMYEARVSGTYGVVVHWNNVADCGDSINDLQVVVHPTPEPAINWDGVVLSTESGFSSYQWFAGSELISEATDSSYTPTLIGAYSVSVIDSNGCSGTSRVYNITQINSVTNKHTPYGLCSVYPNPITSGTVYVDWPSPVNLTVYNLDGRARIQRLSVNQLDVSSLPAGTYLMQVKSEEGYPLLSERVVIIGR